jgi:DHA1 family multidrug resistance protein-like MFS transporter
VRLSALAAASILTRILADGTGPLIFSPLSELPSLGRNPLYVAPYALVFFLSIGIPLTPSIAGLLVLRFLTGCESAPTAQSPS